jgi:hypothetical protein
MIEITDFCNKIINHLSFHNMEKFDLTHSYYPVWTTIPNKSVIEIHCRVCSISYGKTSFIINRDIIMNFIKHNINFLNGKEIILNDDEKFKNSNNSYIMTIFNKINNPDSIIKQYLNYIELAEK